MDGFENDRRSLRGKETVDRREMLAASLAVGFRRRRAARCGADRDPYGQRRP